MCWHPIADSPFILIEFDLLAFFDTTEQLSAPLMTFRTKRIDLPALEGMCPDLACRRVQAVGWYRGFCARHEWTWCEETVAAGNEDVEPMAAHISEE